MILKKILLSLLLLIIGGGIGFGVTKFIDKPNQQVQTQATTTDSTADEKTISEVVASLRDKKGDDFDKELLDQMILHNQGAIDMANLIQARSERDELLKWSQYVIKSQSTDITQMKTWYSQWGYRAEDVKNSGELEAH